MRSTTPFLSFLLALPFTAHATTWQVGPGLTYTLPSQVSTLVANGDTVDIAAGNYPSDVAAWTADDLLLRGVGGFAHLESNGMSWGDKAIWVIQGDRTTVEWVEFSECSVPDENGAGIRQEGKGLVVRQCYFHDNENGILAGEIHPSTMVIEHSEFDHNGFGDGFSHNLYIGNIDSLIFRFNYSHHAHIGHELKSRAYVNVMEYNRFSNEATGDASREVDLPNGGHTYLIGNVIQQGPLGENSNLVAYGIEGLTNPGTHEFYAINNTLVNEKNVGSFFAVMNGADLFKAYSNILAGGGTFTPGWWPATVDTLANVVASIAAVQFVSPAAYDYHLQTTSPADNTGFPAGVANSGYPLVAWYEYLHPLGFVARCQQATLDVGAFETCTTGVEDVPTVVGSNGAMHVAPNPAAAQVQVSFVAQAVPATIEILDAQGRVLRSWPVNGQHSVVLELNGLSVGLHVLRASGAGGMFTERLIVR